MVKALLLENCLNQANTFLANIKKIDSAASLALGKIHKCSLDSEDGAEIIKMYNCLLDSQIKAMSIINSIIEKFPVEATVDEQELLELYRRFSERKKVKILQDMRTALKDTSNG